MLVVPMLRWRCHPRSLGGAAHKTDWPDRGDSLRAARHHEASQSAREGNGGWVAPVRGRARPSAPRLRMAAVLAKVCVARRGQAQDQACCSTPSPPPQKKVTGRK